MVDTQIWLPSLKQRDAITYKELWQKKDALNRYLLV